MKSSCIETFHSLKYLSIRHTGCQLFSLIVHIECMSEFVCIYVSVPLKTSISFTLRTFIQHEKQQPTNIGFDFTF